jgi:tetratricopeptide (TPR) repeat protein
MASEAGSSGLSNNAKLTIAAGVAAVGAGLYLIWRTQQADIEGEAAPVAANAALSQAQKLYEANRKAGEAKTGKSEAESKTSETSIESAEYTAAKAEANKTKDLGNDAYKKGRKENSTALFEEALVFYSQAIEQYPGRDSDLAKFYTNRAVAYKMLNRHTDVLDDCTQALALSPPNGIKKKAVERRGEAHKELQNWQGALHDYLVGMALDPDFKRKEKATATELEALVELFAKNEAERLRAGKAPSLPDASSLGPYFDGFSKEKHADSCSVDELSKLISEEPEQGELFLRRAQLNLAEHAYDAVFDDATTAVEKLNANAKDGDPSAPLVTALTIKGTFHHLRGELEQATETFDAALAIDPSFIEALIKRGLASFEKRTAEGCQSGMKDIEAAINLAPKSPSAYYHRGHLSLLINKPQSAVQDFEKSIELGHKGYNPYLQIGRAKFAMQQHEEASKVFEIASALFPEEPIVLTQKGQILAMKNDLQGAIDTFDAAMKADPLGPLPLVNKADLFLKIGRVPEGLALLQDAIKLDPRNIQARNVLLHRHIENKEFEPAIEHFQELVKSTSNITELVQFVSFMEMCKMRILLKAEGFKFPSISKNTVFGIFS